MSVLKLIPIEFHQSFTVTGIDRCPHISIVSSDRFWVSDVNNGLILSNTQGKSLPQDHWLNIDRPNDIYNGLHTVNNDGELIYIDSDQCIYKLSNDGCKLPFVKQPGSTWKRQCVYWSSVTRSLLVGMYNGNKKTGTGKVIRYNHAGKMTQTIQYNIAQKLYRILYL